MYLSPVSLGFTSAHEFADVRDNYSGDGAYDTNNHQKFDQGKSFLSTTELFHESPCQSFHLASPFIFFSGNLDISHLTGLPAYIKKAKQRLKMRG